MKKIRKNNSTVLVPRSIRYIEVYADEDKKTIRTDFSMDDWSDMMIGFHRQTKQIRKEGCAGLSKIEIRDIVIEQSIQNLSDARLYRAIILTFHALIPTQSRFSLIHTLIYDSYYGSDHISDNPKAVNIDELFQCADQKLIKHWFKKVNRVIWPILNGIFNTLHRRNQMPLKSQQECLPPFMRQLIEQMKETARKLPVYQTDFKGVIVDGLIQHELDPYPPRVREAQWKGGFHVNSKSISVSQIVDQGGSFGPVCLFYLEHFSPSNQ